MLESDDEIEPFLLSADLVATCFSTAGLDYDYLQYYSRRPLGRFLYLNIGKQIARTLEKIIGKAIVLAQKIVQPLFVVQEKNCRLI